MEETTLDEAIKWAAHMQNVLESNIKYAEGNDSFKKFHDECLVHKSCLSTLKACAEEFIKAGSIEKGA